MINGGMEDRSMESGVLVPLEAGLDAIEVEGEGVSAAMSKVEYVDDGQMGG